MSDSAEPRAAGWRFFLWWMLAFLGFPLGGLLALVLVGSVEGVVSGALGGALAGAVIGLAQWLVLRRNMRLGPEWILATALGVAIAWPVGWTVTWAFGIDVERGYYVFGASGALVFAAVTGLAMLLMLRGRAR